MTERKCVTPAPYGCLKLTREQILYEILRNYRITIGSSDDEVPLDTLHLQIETITYDNKRGVLYINFHNSPQWGEDPNHDLLCSVVEGGERPMFHIYETHELHRKRMEENK